MVSLRLKLLSSILVATLAAWGFATVRSYRDTRKEVDRLFDAHMIESAAALLKQATHEWRERESRDRHEDDEYEDHDDDDYGISDLRERGELLEKRLVFEFWNHDGQLILRSGRELKGIEPPDGFSNYEEGSVHLRVFAQWNDDRTLRVVVAESIDARLTLAKATVSNIIRPLIWVIVPLILLLAIIIEWTLRPIRILSSGVERRNANDLSAIDEDRIPAELKPIVKALNSLFERLSRAIDNERRFTADAAHELRTPLAAIKVQAQVALRAGEDSARNRALEAVGAGVDRATHLVDQLLTLARLDPETSYPTELVSLRFIAEQVLQELAPMAVNKSIEIDLVPGDESLMRGHLHMLSVLIRNLVDNAIRYTPSFGRIRVLTSKLQDGFYLTIEDSGTGLTQEQIKRLGQRFDRVDRPSGEGSGLGLSIVFKIAAIHHAKISFENRSSGSGLIVKVCFPFNNIES